MLLFRRILATLCIGLALAGAPAQAPVLSLSHAPAISVPIAQAQDINVLNGGGAPYWVLRGQGVPAAVDLNFAQGQYYQANQPRGPPVASLVTVSRASTAYEDDLAGNWTSFGNNVLRVTNKGALIEEARTNSIPNNSMQGAIVSGAIPTGWQNGSPFSGLTRTVKSLQAILGVDTITFNYAGTSNAAGGFIVPQGNTSAAALNGQTWAGSMFLSVVVNSGSTPTFNLQITERDIGGAVLANTSTAVSPTSTLARFSTTRTNNNASTAFETLPLQVNLVNTNSYDFDLTMGWPGLELLPSATASVSSPIRTTNAAATRAADAVTLTKVPTLPGSASLFMKGTPNSPVTYANNQVALSVDDGTLNNRLQIGRRNTSGNVWLVQTTGGVTAVDTNNTPVLTQNVSSRIAAAFGPSDQAIYGNGTQTATNASGTPPTSPTLTAVHIGARSDSTFQFDGYIERIALWPSTRLPNAALQTITAVGP